MDHDANDRAIFSVPNRPHFGGQRLLPVDHDAASELVERAGRRMAVQHCLILFVQLVAWVHNSVGELAVVRQQQQSLGVAIEPANRQDAALHTDEIHHRVATTFI